MSALNMKQLEAACHNKGHQEAHRHTKYEMRTSATWFPKLAEKKTERTTKSRNDTVTEYLHNMKNQNTRVDRLRSRHHITGQQICLQILLMDRLEGLCHTRHKIGHFGDVLSSQSLGIVLRN